MWAAEGTDGKNGYTIAFQVGGQSAHRLHPVTIPKCPMRGKRAKAESGRLFKGTKALNPVPCLQQKLSWEPRLQGGCWDHTRPREAETNQGGPCPGKAPVACPGPPTTSHWIPNGKDFWSSSREERGVGGGGAGTNLIGGLQKASSGAGSKTGSGASARKFPSWSIYYMPHT